MAPVQSVSTVQKGVSMQVVARNALRCFLPIRSAPSMNTQREVFCADIRAKHELDSELNFLEHLRALRIASGSVCRLGAIHPTA
jgi:hypothetical protein